MNIYLNILDCEATRIISGTRPLSICAQCLDTNLKDSLYPNLFRFTNSFSIYGIVIFDFKI